MSFHARSNLHSTCLSKWVVLTSVSFLEEISVHCSFFLPSRLFLGNGWLSVFICSTHRANSRYV